MGFDPSMGLMHADKRYRPSLPSDVGSHASSATHRIRSEPQWRHMLNGWRSSCSATLNSRRR
jgi:hypothetical protein